MFGLKTSARDAECKCATRSPPLSDSSLYARTSYLNFVSVCQFSVSQEEQREPVSKVTGLTNFMKAESVLGYGSNGCFPLRCSGLAENIITLD